MHAPAPSAGQAFSTPAQLVRCCLCRCKAFIKQYVSDLKTLIEKVTRLACARYSPSRIAGSNDSQGS